MEMLSLYDFLERAAGTELGEQVYKAASTSNVKIQTRFVSNKKYAGKVMLYPKQFLQEYFKNNKNVN